MIEARMVIHDLEEVALVVARLDEALSAAGVPRIKALDMRLCLMEAIHNGLCHGNGLDERKNVTISWHIEGRTFCFCVEDEGHGFTKDCVVFDENDMTQFLAESGKGLYLMGQISDEIWYNERGNQVNVRISW